jgi:hypothetical protein
MTCLAPRTESYDARIARHDFERGHLCQAARLGAWMMRFLIDEHPAGRAIAGDAADPNPYSLQRFT